MDSRSGFWIFMVERDIGEREREREIPEGCTGGGGRRRRQPEKTIVGEWCAWVTGVFGKKKKKWEWEEVVGWWILTVNQNSDVFIPHLLSKRENFPLQIRYNAKEFRNRAYPKIQFAVSAVAAFAKTSVEDIEGSSSPSQDFSVTASGTSEANELRLSVEVSGAKTEAIFDDVLSKMAVAAQPIPGFRRVKGGKTPNIPQDVLLQILGPSEVYKQVIKKVINSTIAEYVEKEGLTVSTDLRVEQSFEDLEAKFEPGGKFSFDAVVQLRELN
ncbi:hypothetical protein RHMOL_Rhmol02G0092300 [Rhododendron molle]|uniref:Uncharacterized protein n=1 Tax=Rhododendron molle TaxID=49168 RepID=A0ACC0PPK2_RHOML|nr:hypothetical protein RHMOL_Rhmol02G0092300 [Rhododendron molle]